MINHVKGRRTKEIFSGSFRLIPNKRKNGRLRNAGEQKRTSVTGTKLDPDLLRDPRETLKRDFEIGKRYEIEYCRDRRGTGI